MNHRFFKEITVSHGDLIDQLKSLINSVENNHEHNNLKKLYMTYRNLCVSALSQQEIRTTFANTLIHKKKEYLDIIEHSKEEPDNKRQNINREKLEKIDSMLQYYLSVWKEQNSLKSALYKPSEF